MGTSRSIIENMELSTGTDLYIQASTQDRIVLSFDSSESGFTITLTRAELLQYQALLTKVIEELK